MKRYLATAVIAGLALSPWLVSQESKSELFDLKKSRQELEVMRGILRTTLRFALEELRSRQSERTEAELVFAFAPGWELANISSYYLYGQGAVFMIPASGLRTHFAFAPEAAHAFEEAQHKLMEAQQGLMAKQSEIRHSAAAEKAAELARKEAELAKLRAEIEAERRPFGGVQGGVAGGVPGGVIGGVVGGVAVAPPPPPEAPPAAGPAPLAVPPQTPSPPHPLQPAQQARESEQMKKKLAGLKEKVETRKVKIAADRAKFIQNLDQIENYLVEAVAKHGDSLTQVKPTEYITVIIAEDGHPFFPGEGQEKPTRSILSVQKSAITEYKAGKTSLESFKQKVLIYAN